MKDLLEPNVLASLHRDIGTGCDEYLAKDSKNYKAIMGYFLAQSSSDDFEEYERARLRSWVGAGDETTEPAEVTDTRTAAGDVVYTGVIVRDAKIQHSPHQNSSQSSWNFHSSPNQLQCGPPFEGNSMMNYQDSSGEYGIIESECVPQ